VTALRVPNFKGGVIVKSLNYCANTLFQSSCIRLIHKIINLIPVVHLKRTEGVKAEGLNSSNIFSL